MPRYAIKAPDGNTYQIDGPAGASDDQVRAEVLRQHPNAESPPPPPATLGSTLVRAAVNTPGDILKTDKAILGLPGEAVNAALHPIKTAQAIGSAVSGAIDTAKGGIQRVRELSPANLRGDAPAMGTGTFDKFAAENRTKYGTKQGLYKEIGDHPVGTALTVASVAAPALKAVGATDAIAGALTRGAEAVAAPASRTIKTVTQAERRANALSGTMRTETETALTAGQRAAQEEAEAAQTRSARVAALAERARTRGKTLSDRSSAAAAQSIAPEPTIGETRSLSERGQSIRDPANARADKLHEDMRAADTKYRSAMEAVAADRAAAGVGVSDTDAAKALIAKSRALVEPDPVARPSVGSVPADSAGGKLHKELLERLAPKEQRLTVAQAKDAVQQGIEVHPAPDGGFVRTIKPSLEDADNFRRYVGQVLDGKVEGYAGLNAAHAREIYADVSKAMDEYVGGAHADVQASWREGKKALEPYEKVRAGMGIVGTQPGTKVSAVPAASIPGRMIAGGADTVRQTMAVAGDEPVKAALRSHVQDVFKGTKTADAAEKKLAPGTALHDAISVDPSLESAVSEYLKQRRTAEGFGAQAKDLAGRADTNMGRSDRLDKIAATLQGDATRATDLALKHTRELAQLEIAAPKDVGAKYLNMLNEAHQARRINEAQYKGGQRLAQSAEKEFALKASRDKWLKRAALYAGVTGASSLGLDIAHTLGSH